MTIRTHTFSNGFRVIHETPENHMPISHVNVFCRVGSAFEDDSLRGASQFIEHMCFKGTPHYPSTRDISVEYDRIGADFNAYTEKQYTCYTSKFHDVYAKHCLEILADIMLHSLFNEREYKKEMNVVIEENKRNLTNYTNTVYDIVAEMVYRGSVYAHPVDTMDFHPPTPVWKYSDVVAFYRKYYVPENIVLSIVSSLPFSTVIRFVKQTEFVQRVNRKTRAIAPILNTVPRMVYDKQTAIQIKLEPVKNIETAYVAISFRTCSLYSEDRYGLHLLRFILGGTITSRLFTILREENGLTYTSRVDSTYYESMGEMTFFAITDSRKLIYACPTARTRRRGLSRSRSRSRSRSPSPRGGGRKKGVLPLIMDMLIDIVKHGVSEKEIADMKKYIEGKRQMNLEDSETQVSYNGLQLLLHNETEVVPYRKTYREFYADLTRKEIHELIRKYIRPENMNIAMVGGNLPGENAIRKIAQRLRA